MKIIFHVSNFIGMLAPDVSHPVRLPLASVGAERALERRILAAFPAYVSHQRVLSHVISPALYAGKRTIVFIFTH